MYAGVDYEAILRRAEAEADVIVWDGGNNDTPFYKPSLWVCVADPHRPNAEVNYYPGDVNFRCADVIVVNKASFVLRASAGAGYTCHAGACVVCQPCRGVQRRLRVSAMIRTEPANTLSTLQCRAIWGLFCVAPHAHAPHTH